jgi:hypothetical protein
MARHAHNQCGFLTSLLERVGSDDSEEVVSAAAFLHRIGPPAVKFIIAEAAKPSTPVVHKFRLLGLATVLGGERGLTENRQLLALRQHWCPAIRARAEEVFASLIPRRNVRCKNGEVYDASRTNRVSCPWLRPRSTP